MSELHPPQIFSRLPEAEFFDRSVEMDQLLALAKATTGHAKALVLGAPRVGKSELLRKTFDRLFALNGNVAPIYYSLNEVCRDGHDLARDYFAQALAQLLAFRRQDAQLIAAANEPLETLTRRAAPQDGQWVRNLIESFLSLMRVGDTSLLLRAAFAAPITAAARMEMTAFVMFDNVHLLTGSDSAATLSRAELLKTLVRPHPAGSVAPAGQVLCGLRRPLLELLPPDEALFDGLDLLTIEPMGEEFLQRLIELSAARLEVAISDSTIELMIQQLHHDLFYTRAILDAAAARGAALKTFMDFERLYTSEVLRGRIGHYLAALLREVAPDTRTRRAALELLRLVAETGDLVPIEAALERLRDWTPDGDGLLARLSARELIESGYGFISASSDVVLDDYVRALYRTEIAGAQRPLAGEELLSEKLKHSYRLMMSRYHRAIESQLVESLSRFDFQNVPTSLFHQQAFETHYRGLSRVQTRRLLESEGERLRLPQIVTVNQIGRGEQQGIQWKLFAASGFEGGIYSDASEIGWLIALINAKEPLDGERLARIEQKVDLAARTLKPSAAVRWYLSQEGFSAAAAERLVATHAYYGNFTQLDLLYDFLVKLVADEPDMTGATEFELVIPIEDEAELIAARTVEQIARTADFDQEAINQIKTALIEACINAAEHSESPDRKIYQKFKLEGHRLIITVANKGKSLDWTATPSAASSAKATRGRGLQIIRALMDDVWFERTDDGTVLVMTKVLKRPHDA